MTEHKFETKFNIGDKVLAYFDKLDYGIINRIEIQLEMFTSGKNIRARYFITPINDGIQKTFKEDQIFKDKEELIDNINKL